MRGTMKKEDRVRLARALITLNDPNADVARRYLQLRRRIRRLRGLLGEPDNLQRYGHIVALISKVKKQRGQTGRLLDQALNGHERLRRFCVVVRRQDVAEALARIEVIADQTLSIAYREGGPFVLQREAVEALEGDRAGAQVVYRADLESLLQIKGEVIALDVFQQQWIAYVTFSLPDGKVKQIGPLVYTFPKHKE